MTCSLLQKSILVAVFSCCFLIVSHAQRNEQLYLPNQFYFKVNDDYQGEFYAPTPIVDIRQQIPFFNYFADQFGAQVTRPFFFSSYEPLRRVFRVFIQNEEDAQAFSEKLGATGEVEYIERIPRLLPIGSSTDDPDDPNWADGQQWYLDVIQSRDAWTEGALGREIVVAVVDNAFQMDHADFDTAKWVTPLDLANWDSDPSVGTAVSAMSHHGTHVMGLIGAATDNNFGMAAVGNQAKIMPIKASYDTELDVIATRVHTGEVGVAEELSMGYEAMEAAIVLKANIINASWGNYLYSVTAQYIVDHAKLENVIIVAAAGNDKLSEELMYPAAYDYVISVGATTSRDDKWSQSNYGEWIDIAAPGHKIHSTMPSDAFGYESGTSMASPIVASVCALVWSINPQLSAIDVIDCVLTSGDDIGLSGILGDFRVNAINAVKCAMERSAELPPGGEERSILAFKAAPNPMQTHTYFEYELRNDTNVYLEIYDRMGNVVAQPIAAQYQEAGYHQVSFKRQNLSTGLYYCRLITSNDVRELKLYITD